MAVQVTEDLVAGMRVRHNKQGYWATRELFVEGLDPTAPPGLVFGQTYPGGHVPDYNEAHPYLFGCYCYEIEAMPPGKNARGQLKVVASYGPGEMVNQWRVTISGSNGFKTLTLDKNGKQFQLKYLPLPGLPGTPAPVTQVDIPNFQYLAPGSVITFEHEEIVPPWNKIQQIKSHTNSVAFLGQEPHHVLCRDVSVESLRSLTAWRVRYMFEVAPDALGWNQSAIFHDRYTGQIPSNIDVTITDGSVGYLVIDPYSEQGLTFDFNSLNLPTGQI